MKSIIHLLLVTAWAFLSWHANAQTSQTASPFWVVNGKVYNINENTSWERFDGTVLKVFTNELVVQIFTLETKQQAVVVKRLNQNYGNSTRYHDETQMVDVGTEKVPGRKIIIRNYPIAENPAVGKTIAFYAMQTGTSDYQGDKLELWDLGTPATPDDLKEIYAAIDERRKAAETELENQRRYAQERAAAAKKAAADKALQWNQEQADKGDPSALRRMGERYRDGDGVVKDLAKSEDYFKRAGAAVEAEDKKAREETLLREQEEKRRRIASLEAQISKGSVSAMNTLGKCYRDGDGVEKDVKKAKEIFQKAAGTYTPGSQQARMEAAKLSLTCE